MTASGTAVTPSSSADGNNSASSDGLFLSSTPVHILQRDSKSYSFKETGAQLVESLLDVEHSFTSTSPNSEKSEPLFPFYKRETKGQRI